MTFNPFSGSSCSEIFGESEAGSCPQLPCRVSPPACLLLCFCPQLLAVCVRVCVRARVRVCVQSYKVCGSGCCLNRRATRGTSHANVQPFLSSRAVQATVVHFATLQQSGSRHGSVFPHVSASFSGCHRLFWHSEICSGLLWGSQSSAVILLFCCFSPQTSCAVRWNLLPLVCVGLTALQETYCRSY